MTSRARKSEQRSKSQLSWRPSPVSMLARSNSTTLRDTSLGDRQQSPFKFERRRVESKMQYLHPPAPAIDVPRTWLNIERRRAGVPSTESCFLAHRPCSSHGRELRDASGQALQLKVDTMKIPRQIRNRIETDLSSVARRRGCGEQGCEQLPVAASCLDASPRRKRAPASAPQPPASVRFAGLKLTPIRAYGLLPRSVLTSFQ